VLLIPVLAVIGAMSRSAGWAAAIPNFHPLLRAIWGINLGLLIFNMMPIFPLDGGQILRSLLWFVLGRARSLLVAVIIGFIGVVAFIGLAVWVHSTWLGILAVFMLMNCWGGLQHARALLRFAKLPRRAGYVCPECKTPPPAGELWKCSQCGQVFDTFQTGAACPRCGMQYPVTKCLDCGRAHPMHEWAEAAVMAPRV
jgi:hypothetical protein